MSDALTLDDKLQAFVGQSAGPATRGSHPVNEPMIEHWVEAMGDYNPVYVDDAAARAAGFPGVDRPADHAAGLDHAGPAGQPRGRRRP